MSDQSSHPDVHIVQGHYYTGEQLLDLVWNVAGATMAALGTDRDDATIASHLVEPTIRDLVREYGIAIPRSYRR